MDNLETTEGITYLEFTIATKELIGFRSEFITDTKGLGIMNAAFFEFLPDDGFSRDRERGSLVAYETGETRLYGMTQVQDQGELFYGPSIKVYKGEVVGQHTRTGDLRINVCKEKHLRVTEVWNILTLREQWVLKKLLSISTIRNLLKLRPNPSE
jgi:GTP-binding protein